MSENSSKNPDLNQFESVAAESAVFASVQAMEAAAFFF